MPTLCVIDMQTSFMASRHCLGEVLKQIEISKVNREGIVVVEYREHGPTHSKITSALKDYPLSTTAIKMDDGGANEFIAAATKSGFSLDVVVAVGVNRGWCVYETVKGILERGIAVQVVENATWASDDPDAELESLMSLGQDYNILEVI